MKRTKTQKNEERKRLKEEEKQEEQSKFQTFLTQISEGNSVHDAAEIAGLEERKARRLSDEHQIEYHNAVKIGANKTKFPLEKEQKFQKLLQYLRSGKNMDDAAKAVDVASTTAYYWKRTRFVEIGDALKAGELKLNFSDVKEKQYSDLVTELDKYPKEGLIGASQKANMKYGTAMKWRCERFISRLENEAKIEGVSTPKVDIRSLQQQFGIATPKRVNTSSIFSTVINIQEVKENPSTQPEEQKIYPEASYPKPHQA